MLAAAWLASMLLLSPYDLEISKALANRSALDGILVYRLGEIPGWIAIVLSLYVLIRTWQKDIPRLEPFKPLAITIISQALLIPLAVTQLLKYFWGRVRFMHLAPGFSDYTPFWQPAGVGSGASFPSGHVAMAALLASIPFFLWQEKKHRSALASGIVTAGWGLFVSWGRIRSGSHYMTDCVMSLGLGWLGAALLLYVLKNRAKSQENG